MFSCTFCECRPNTITQGLISCSQLHKCASILESTSRQIISTSHLDKYIFSANCPDLDYWLRRAFWNGRSSTHILGPLPNSPAYSSSRLRSAALMVTVNSMYFLLPTIILCCWCKITTKTIFLLLLWACTLVEPRITSDGRNSGTWSSPKWVVSSGYSQGSRFDDIVEGAKQYLKDCRHCGIRADKWTERVLRHISIRERMTPFTAFLT